MAKVWCCGRWRMPNMKSCTDVNIQSAQVQKEAASTTSIQENLLFEKLCKDTGRWWTYRELAQNACTLVRYAKELRWRTRSTRSYSQCTRKIHTASDRCTWVHTNPALVNTKLNHNMPDTNFQKQKHDESFMRSRVSKSKANNYICSNIDFNVDESHLNPRILLDVG